MSDSEFEVLGAAIRKRYSSPLVTGISDPASALLSQPIIRRQGLVFISSTLSFQLAKPSSTIDSTDTTSV